MTDDEIYKNIGKNIKYYRMLYSLNVEKMTQEKLAEKVDVSTSLIGSLESDKTNCGVSIATLYRISQALDVPINKFFEVPPNERNRITRYKL